MGYFAGTSVTNVIARGGLQSSKIFCSCWILETSKGADPRILTHRQSQWLQLTGTEFAVEEAETLLLLPELCEPARAVWAHCCADRPLRLGQAKLQGEEKGKKRQSRHEGWGKALKIWVCDSGFSCHQSILGTAHMATSCCSRSAAVACNFRVVSTSPVQVPQVQIKPLGADTWAAQSPRVRLGWDLPKRDLPNKPDLYFSAQKEDGVKD